MVPLNDLDPMAVYWEGLFETNPVWVAERDGAVAGFCLRDDDNIGGFYVAREARRKGVGKRLLDLARGGAAGSSSGPIRPTPKRGGFIGGKGLSRSAGKLRRAPSR